MFGRSPFATKVASTAAAAAAATPATPATATTSPLLAALSEQSYLSTNSNSNNINNNSSNNSSAATMTTLMRQRAVAQLQEALLMIPVELKVAYLEALQRAPQLVESESDPIMFLRCENYNAWNAAQRLVSYWRQRKELFGDRAFLPIDLSGNGALNAEDIESVKKGGYSLLVNDPQCGNSILYVDRSRDPSTIQGTPSLTSRVRRVFFFVQKACFNPESQASGLVVISRPGPIISRSFNVIITELLRSAMPLKIKAIHMVYMRQNKRTFMQTIVPFILEQFGSWLSNLMVVHNCDTPEQAVAKLASHGISQRVLPQCFGGPWTYEVHFMRFLLDHGLMVSAPSASSPRLNATNAMLDLLANSEARNLAPLGNTGMAYASRREGALEITTVARANNTSNHGGDQENNTMGFEESPEIQQRGLAALNDALQLISEADRAAYMEALRRVPHLVQKESNPLRMLRSEKYNAWAAASRLAVYWKNRVAVFEENAFLPITQTTGGALSDEDIRGLNSGFIFLLPKDSRGRNVVCYDPSKRPNVSLQTRIRICFYLWTVICENPISQTDGYVVIILLGSPGFGSTSLDGENPRVVTDTIMDSMPTRPCDVHVVYKPPEKRSFVDHILPIALRCLGRVMDQKTQFHVGDGDDEIIRKFEMFGISKQGLPSNIGGDHDESTVQAWMTFRRREEMQTYTQRLPAAVGARPSATAVPLSMTSPLVTSSAIATAAAPRELAPPPAASAESLQLGLRQIESALQLLPENEKAAYLEAMRQVPELVQKESAPAQFLQYANYDAIAAARLLARYWTSRKEIFTDRAFLPMDQTGDGALERKDVVVLQSGYLTQLPCDAEGRAVLCCDGTRLQKSSNVSRLRCAFYMWSVAAENELSQTAGYSVLYAVTEPSFDRANKECLDLVMQCIPARLRAFHVLGVPPEDSTVEAFRDGPVKDTLKILHASIQERAVTHIGSSRGDLGRRLGAYGIRRSGLPISLGGKWGFQEFVQWSELRVRHEWGLSIGAGTRSTAEQFNIPTCKLSGDLTEQEKNERKRRMNVIHSRRKRERERIEVEVLNEQCLELKEDRNKLKQEGRRLENLVRQAQSAISTNPSA